MLFSFSLLGRALICELTVIQFISLTIIQDDHERSEEVTHALNVAHL